MKDRVIFFCLVLALAAPGYANEPSNSNGLCVVMSDLAGNLMRARQDGAPMTKAMEIAQNADGQLREVITKMVIAAYERPQFSVKENREREVVDFSNQVALECYKAFN